MYLEDLITSDVRIKLIKELFAQTNKHLYVRELTRLVGTEINAVRRELTRFVESGMIKKEQRGNRLYYIVQKDHPFYYEILGMVAKESGIGMLILNSKEKLGSLNLALLAVEFTEGRKAGNQEVDLLIVGEVNHDQLDLLIKRSSIISGRELNYTVMSEADFLYNKKRRDSFLMKFLLSPYVHILGDRDKYLSEKED